MNVNITGLHIPISDSLKEYIEKKVRKLKKYNEKLTEADFTISVEKNNNIVKAKIYGKNIKYKCEERTNDMYD
ncbi:MAG TPA: ribosome-associated translation inhibitor RaiA, partial [bacterium]|nr:ribosome-associated translation inhibitor RaiA [bacterium]